MFGDKSFDLFDTVKTDIQTFPAGFGIGSMVVIEEGGGGAKASVSTAGTITAACTFE